MQDLGDIATPRRTGADGKMRSLLPKPSGWEKDWIGRSAHLRYLKFDLSRLQTADFTHASQATPHVEW